MSAGEGLAYDAADAEAPDAVSADRAVLLAKTGRMGGRDLVAGYMDGSVKLDELDEDELPDNMKKLSAKERKDLLEKQSVERKRIQVQLKDLEVKRNAFIKAERAKTGDKSSFDVQVGEMLRKQAAKKGFKF